MSALAMPSVLAVRAQEVRTQVESRLPAALAIRKPLPAETLSLGVAGLPGVPRGALTEICGAASSGRTTLLLSLLSETTRHQQACALVDAGNAFDPASAARAGVDLARLLWVPAAAGHGGPMSRLEQTLKATDLLLAAGGFALVALDMADLPATAVRRIPLASWFRFRRAVEGTSTALVALEPQPFAQSSASLVLRLKLRGGRWAAAGEAAVPSHARRLAGLEIEVETARDRVLSPGKFPPQRCTEIFLDTQQFYEPHAAV